MIRFYILGQVLRLYTPCIAADTINYLTGKAEFADEAWDGYTKWGHFRKGETVYDIQLNDEDEFAESASLNLVAGEWDVYFTGTSGNARLTTNTVILTVTESGLRDSPLHALPLSVAETLDAKSSLALRTANSIKAKADAGEFNGKDGKSFTIVGYVQTAEDLPETGTEGEMYGVGSEAPYRIYAWDSVNGVWVDNGTIQGPAGEAGEAGKYAVPALDTSGNLTWAWSDGSEGGLPGQQNIRGGTGPAGAQGAAGKSAYSAAVEGGYLGDEAGFNAKLSTFDAHAANHAEGGSDELTDKSIGGGKLKDGAVARSKLAQDALYSPVESFDGTRALTAADIGKTLASSGAGENTVTLTTAVSAAMPMGAEIAVFWMAGTSVKLQSTGTMRIVMPGEDVLVNGSLQLSKMFTLVALKKIKTDAANGDIWTVQGDVEVVT